jgi:hypothetical protein
MIRFLLILQILFSANIYCQNAASRNNKDTLDNKEGIRIEYDIEHIKYSETMYVSDNIKYFNYFSRQGDTISVYNWKIDVTAINKIKEKILNNFTVNDFTYVAGSAVLLLMLDCKKNIFEIRIIKGITPNFNKELLRVINKIEKDLIFICTTDCKIPIVTPFAIRLNE